MATLFRADIISASRVFFRGKIQCIIIPALDGKLAIMANHQEMIIAVQTGEIRFQLEDGTWKSAAVGTGQAEISHNRFILLVSTAEYPEEIDVARAKASYERAQEAMRQQQSMLEYHRSKMAMARAMARLREADRTKA